ncbi:hypothetical protein BJ684DRAFT_15724 [Piptocephalis cylindrospora]|uniref:Uncharacterized protein n=1 Tax=Piptocephalis cylindrospora TaxID=1907219 RepID=A0A4P9Y4M9_9FUNG|nr:hypothetical protein BJ684DRAFT_15724 [Piptocephalis cylindrospora]|eukprot:RKP13926.1 hypothetical protein BJ684DRAFT_15724 [Piptocephalis cylindrospora]
MSVGMQDPRISQILPTMKCNDCGVDIEFRRIAEHRCGEAPPMPALPPMPSTLHKKDSGGSSLGSSAGSNDFTKPREAPKPPSSASSSTSASASSKAPPPSSSSHKSPSSSEGSQGLSGLLAQSRLPFLSSSSSSSSSSSPTMAPSRSIDDEDRSSTPRKRYDSPETYRSEQKDPLSNSRSDHDSIPIQGLNPYADEFAEDTKDMATSKPSLNFLERYNQLVGDGSGSQLAMPPPRLQALLIHLHLGSDPL